MLQTTGWRRWAIALVIVVGGVQGLACSDEIAPAAELGGDSGGLGGDSGVSAPAPAVTAEPPQTEARASVGKPGLAAKMRALIDESGDAAAANTALMNFYSDGMGDFEMDEAGVIALGREYLEAGDDTMAEVVFSFLQMAAYQVTGGVSADLWAAQGDVSLVRGNTDRAQGMYEDALSTDPDHAYSKERLAALGGAQAAKPSSVTSGPVETGEAQNRLSIGRRDDLARFRFQYTEDGGSNRTLMVSETCYNSGVLRAVAQWDDAQPWVFESVSETVFEQVNAPEGKTPVRLEFQVHHGHGGVQAVVASGGSKGRFEEAGYLPEGFEPEMGTCD